MGRGFRKPLEEYIHQIYYTLTAKDPKQHGLLDPQSQCLQFGVPQSGVQRDLGQDKQSLEWGLQSGVYKLGSTVWGLQSGNPQSAVQQDLGQDTQTRFRPGQPVARE